MTNSMRKRMKIVTAIFLLVVLAVTAKLGYEQLFHAQKLESGALNTRLREIDIKSSRGTIYDRNGNALAISIATDSVYINPKIVREADERQNIEKRQNKQDVIDSLATILELDTAEVAEKIEKNASFVYIKRHITDEQSEALKVLNYTGVYFLEESKRAYPKGTLASHVIGFAGIDNQGLNGIELQFDEVLLGTPGRFLIEYDGKGNEVPHAAESYIPSEPGSNIYLTLDETIQYVVERELKEVVTEQNANKATALVMDVKTGAIRAMGNYPDYDPNHYGDVDSSVWNNFAVNGLYEPGSTFKILTTAMALEERATTADEGFYCPGYQYIGKMRMRCHKAAGHGLESFAQGVANSCNPVFVTVSDRVGMGKFYDYLDAFGMTRITGITLPGETGSLIVPEKSAVPYDLAAMAIGQSNAFTPLQMITAISAVANDGYLMQPYIVEKIVSQDGKTVTETQPKVIRQVISSDTSHEASAILETVVSSGTGKPGAIEGYRIAGKTGTAEKVAETGGYSNERVVSFVGYAPADDPQIACLVIVDEPTDAHGGSTAGPVFRQIMEDTLRYLEIPKTVTVTESTGVEEVIVPKLDGMHPVDAIEAIKQAGLTPIVETQGDTLLTYVPADGTKVQKTGNVYLYCADADSTTRIMPSLYGRTIKEVDRILSGMGLVATMNGSGLSTSQSILEGTPVETGTALIVEFHTAEEIEQIRRQEELIRQQEEAMQENQVNESDENSGGEIETEDAV